ncbi:MAG TPA: amidohydrolase family protein, partial [Thermodesulfobacteriota bacterium]|nr:amidohydrolase family protein [Thermodesulfobacteriota bacterium]
MYDIIIQNGLVIDGSGSPGCRMDLAIAGDKIAAVGSLPSDLSTQHIDASHKIVAPGFIDIHSHSDFIYLYDPQADGKIRQGITTELIGQCGLSGAPMLGAYRKQRQEKLTGRDISITWTDLEGYLSRLEGVHPLGNLATLVGHGNLRGGVLGYENRLTTDQELGRMKELLEASMQTGAFGFSSGLIYPPGVYSSTEELIALAKVAASHGGIYATHLRSEGDLLEEAISEALYIAEQTRISLQIAHLKTYGKRNWSKLPAALTLIEAARTKGLSVHADRYPYTASFTDLDVLLPAWAWEGGRAATIGRLADDLQRRKMTEEIVALNPDPAFWSTVIISSVHNEHNRSLEGQSLEKISTDQGISPWEALYDLLRDEELMVTAIFFAMNEHN